ncbi:hypothetical protein OCH74_01305 [Bifidobacterium thermacidophilum]|uniref:Uncharacterized protein n=1 Tax=Bifidobacterium thermacidophilum TaxID=246618 RepID=A0ABW8KLS1_9BIFI|nr:hypothetical protein [Bifidobacterium boum]MCI5861514.1 hypothetical protein [Bifidobacterium boum]
MSVIVKVIVVLVAYVSLVVLMWSLVRVSALADRRAMHEYASRLPAPISREGRVDGEDGRAPRAAGAATAVPYRID